MVCHLAPLVDGEGERFLGSKCTTVNTNKNVTNDIATAMYRNRRDQGLNWNFRISPTLSKRYGTAACCVTCRTTVVFKQDPVNRGVALRYASTPYLNLSLLC